METGKRGRSVDELFILSDFRGHGYDWGRNHGGINADVIQELDADDRITILGTSDSELSFMDVVAGTHNQSQAGIGIFDGEMLEAIYVGSNLDANQLDNITGADPSRFWCGSPSTNCLTEPSDTVRLLW